MEESITKMLKFKLNLKLKQYKLFGSFNAIVKLRYVPKKSNFKPDKTYPVFYQHIKSLHVTYT